MSAHTPGRAPLIWPLVWGADYNSMANADLVDAAPAMLAALQSIATINRFDPKEGFGDDEAFCIWAQSVARAAVAKATGQP